MTEAEAQPNRFRAWAQLACRCVITISKFLLTRNQQSILVASFAPTIQTARLASAQKDGVPADVRDTSQDSDARPSDSRFPYVLALSARCNVTPHLQFLRLPVSATQRERKAGDCGARSVRTDLEPQRAADKRICPATTGPHLPRRRLSVRQNHRLARDVWRFGVILLAAIVGWLARGDAAHAQQVPNSPAMARGANHFDLLMQYLGNASSADGSAAAMAVTKAMGLKAIKDAADYSFSFFRVAVSGFGPSDFADVKAPAGRNSLALWTANPSAYWACVDAMFNDLDKNNIKIVAVLNFNFYQFPALSGETISTMIKFKGSKSRVLLKKYIADFITRYKNRSTILFYELHNEMNLDADIDNVQYCLSNMQVPAQCDTEGNFSSNDLVAYSQDMVSFIKSIDSTRKISSGFGLPRAAASHLAATPSWAPGGPDWTPDTLSQFSSYLSYINGPFDIASIHIYPGDVRYGRPAGTEWQTLDDVVAAAQSVGKPVYLGEFGDNVLNGATSYVMSMLSRMSQDRVQYASPWILEFYQFATYLSSNATSPPPNSLEPGLTDAALAAYGSSFSQVAASAAVRASAAVSKPRVVITSPLPCSNQNGSARIYVVASASGGIDHVDFFSNSTKVATVRAAPFAATVTLTGSTLVNLTAVAYSTSGGSASDSTPILTNGARRFCVVRGKAA